MINKISKSTKLKKKSGIPRNGIPSLAGLCSFKEGGHLGVGVDATVNLLRRLQYCDRQIMMVMLAHLNAVPEWEVKCAFSLHQWQSAEHATWLRRRITEMRTPPLHLDTVPDARLETFFAELIRSASTLELLVGIYGVFKPREIAAIREHLKNANPISDQPTSRLLRFTLQEKQAQLAWGTKAIRALRQAQPAKLRAGAEAWKKHLEAYLAAAGDVCGKVVAKKVNPLPAPRSTAPFEPIRISKRDSRFNRIWHSRGRWLNNPRSRDEKNWHQLYVRLTEMHVPELLALVIYDWKGQPWELYHDVARHLWDECRHSMMGEVAYTNQGEDWAKLSHDVATSEWPNQNLPPQERYLLLYGIEHNMMKKTGKRAEFEAAEASGDRLSKTFHDFDWADEVLHVAIGKRWLQTHYSVDELQTKYKILSEPFFKFINDDVESQPETDWWSAYYDEFRARRQKRGETVEAPAPRDLSQKSPPPAKIEAGQME